jgi:hypothetical protein
MFALYVVNKTELRTVLPMFLVHVAKEHDVEVDSKGALS